MANEFEVGDLVAFRGEGPGGIAVVSRPITQQRPGHVLTLRDEQLIGVTVSIDDVELADESREGFAQLAYHLIELGSHVIERRLITYRR